MRKKQKLSRPNNGSDVDGLEPKLEKGKEYEFSWKIDGGKLSWFLGKVISIKTVRGREEVKVRYYPCKDYPGDEIIHVGLTKESWYYPGRAELPEYQPKPEPGTIDTSDTRLEDEINTNEYVPGTLKRLFTGLKTQSDLKIEAARLDLELTLAQEKIAYLESKARKFNIGM